MNHSPALVENSAPPPIPPASSTPRVAGKPAGRAFAEAAVVVAARSEGAVVGEAAAGPTALATRPAACAKVWEEMRTTCIFTISLLAAALGLRAQEDDKPGHPPIPPPAAVHVLDTAEGLAPRMTPRDYITMGKAGDVVIGAEFDHHSVPARDLTLHTDDFVVVEVGLYGPPGAKLNITLDDFSLRINGKKNVLRSQPYGRVLSSIKDPQWAPPDQGKDKPKTSLGTGGQDSGSPPPVVHPPFELQRGWNVRTQKAALPLGERPLPQAGLLFFQYHGKADNLDSVDLYYDGAAGRTTIPLRP